MARDRPSSAEEWAHDAGEDGLGGFYCKGYEAAYGGTCKLLPDHRSAPLANRVPPR
ncbi:hypothetical protein [Hydrogenophaga sp.]|uniref:hypothetical protein n=1 Tax=Hydrogenophaga sp. TaxID=1904254 RepID=UPI002FC7039C